MTPCRVDLTRVRSVLHAPRGSELCYSDFLHDREKQNLSLIAAFLGTRSCCALRGRNVREICVTGTPNDGRFCGTAAPRLVFRCYRVVARLVLGSPNGEGDDEAQFVAAHRLTHW
jgi:hypothetical protein